MTETFYFAAPVAKRDDGTLLCDFGAAIRCEGAGTAALVAEHMAQSHGYIAAWAFARIGDPVSGLVPKATGLRVVGGCTDLTILKGPGSMGRDLFLKDTCWALTFSAQGAL